MRNNPLKPWEQRNRLRRVRRIGYLRDRCIVLSLLLILGCRGTQSTELKGHHDPEHKPKDFRALVLRLEEIHGFIRDGVSRPSVEEIPIEQEFHDLVGWIEEFASDSDLNEANWRRCKQLKDSMVKRLRDANGESFEQFAATYIKQIDAWQKDIAALVELSPQPRAKPPAVQEARVVENQTEKQTEKQP